MIDRWYSSLSSNFLLWTGGLVICGLLAFSSGMLILRQKEINVNFEVRMSTVINLLAGASRTALEFEDQKTLEFMVSPLKENREFRFIYGVGADPGTVLLNIGDVGNIDIDDWLMINEPKFEYHRDLGIGVLGVPVKTAYHEKVGVLVLGLADETERAATEDLYKSIGIFTFVLLFVLLFGLRVIINWLLASERLQENLELRIQERTVQLEATNKELEVFAYSVSHDLRAPLRSIAGFSQVLLEDYEDKLDDDGKDYLKRVRNATHRMGQLIDDLLKLSRVTRGELKLKSVDLSDLSRATVKNLRNLQPERNVEFVIESGLTVKGDSRLIQTMLENLLGNAWKFTEKRDAAKIEIGSFDQAGEMIYFIHDNGAGFDMTYVDMLFGAFQRLHKLNEFPGTGIGLATVQRIIHRHGGRIWAKGTVDGGATFYFTL
jgi:signal transduction histidine kinase